MNGGRTAAYEREKFTFGMASHALCQGHRGTAGVHMTAFSPKLAFEQIPARP